MTTNIQIAHNELLESYRKSIADIEAQLSVHMLVGSPFLLMAKKDGIERVYGEWAASYLDAPAQPGEKIRGFRGADVVPDSLVGTIQMSRERVDKAIHSCNHSYSNPNDDSIEFYALHYRDFLTARLAKNKAMLVKLEANKF